MDRIGPYTYEEYCLRAREFHGSIAPGIIIGGFMVDAASRYLPPGRLYDVICETVECIPDAVQLLTPCSVGNRWMRIIDVGRFAMAFYDKQTGEGVRVFLDIRKLERWPVVKDWFLKLKPKGQQDRSTLFSQIREAGSQICTLEKITVSLTSQGKKHGKSVSVCPVCNEAYRSEDGEICPACSTGKLPYLEWSEHAGDTRLTVFKVAAGTTYKSSL